MSTYFATLTTIGAAKIANAQALGDVVQITHMAVGDGNGATTVPNPAQTTLVNEVRRAALNTLTVDPLNAAQIVAEQVIPENVGGWWIRELGLIDADGDLVAVANCPDTYKPLLAEGSGRTQVIRMVLVVSSTAAVQLKIDPAVVLATRSYVDAAVLVVSAAIAAHAAHADPHPQYAKVSAVQGASHQSAVAGGTADAITGIYTPAITVLQNGMTLHVRAGAANATTAPTFTPASGSIAAKAIVKGAGAALEVGDIAGAGHWLVLRYDQALDKWVLGNPARGVSALALASSAETRSGTVTDKAVTPAGLSDSVLGSPGQSWQDVKASRALSTTYTNTTGRPIMVRVTTYSSTQASAGDFVVDGTTVSRGTQPSVGYNVMHAVIVPDGSTYSVTQAGASGTVYSWSELR